MRLSITSHKFKVKSNAKSMWNTSHFHLSPTLCLWPFLHRRPPTRFLVTYCSRAGPGGAEEPLHSVSTSWTGRAAPVLEARGAARVHRNTLMILTTMSSTFLANFGRVATIRLQGSKQGDSKEKPTTRHETSFKQTRKGFLMCPQDSHQRNSNNQRPVSRYSRSTDYVSMRGPQSARREPCPEGGTSSPPDTAAPVKRLQGPTTGLKQSCSWGVQKTK